MGINFLIFAVLTIIAGCLQGCNGSGKSNYPDINRDAVVYETEYMTDEEEWSTNDETLSSENLDFERYKAKYDEIYSADNHLIRADGRKIWYNPWTSVTSSGYENKLYVYDSETDSERIINLNKTSLRDDEMMVDDMVDHDGIITIIMSEYRNSNGWLEGTYVWQYDCYSDSWKAIAKECSGAEFVDDRNVVKINNAECLNLEEPTFMQEYRSHYRTVRL